MDNIRVQRSWMYNRLHPGRKGLTTEFVEGVEEFVRVASQLPIFIAEGKFRCPCSKHRNTAFKTPDEVKLDLYKCGFQPDYWYWTRHGEIEPPMQWNQWIASSSAAPPPMEFDPTSYEQMIFDAARSQFPSNEPEVEESPNPEAQNFYDLLNAAQQPLWEGCTTHSELSLSLRMLSIKSDYNVSRDCFNQMAVLLKEVSPSGNYVPDDLYRTKKVVAKLGLQSKKIDCCLNGCMLYYKASEADMVCKFCGHDRFKPKTRKGKSQKNIPYKRLFYLPLIPRLKRLYASMRTAPFMTWHKIRGGDHDPNLLSHPSDGEAWKHFDSTYPEFAAEPRNIRLGLCADGFTPYSQAATPYSCWPVIVTPYNLPPNLCMTTPFLFLTLIIPGPNNPKGKIDVYLQPLIDELQLLWERGVLTYDIASKRNFYLKAVLMWTISDFPAYGMLSGWSTAGKLACPYCMQHIKTFYLKNGRKNCWFDCHRCFLPEDHVFRRNRDAFYKNRVERAMPPPQLTGDDIMNMVSEIPKITEEPALASNRITDFGITHNWTKRSIFWDLPYWSTHLIRHNLDVMHIEKNFFDNIFNTVMDIKGKTKDNVQARLDIKEICKRRELELIETHTGRVVKPKAKYTLTPEQRKSIFEWLHTLHFPSGYVSNLSRCVDLGSSKIYGMKSHDCHIFFQCLLPTAFSGLPSDVLSPLIEISSFFRDICAGVLKVDALKRLQQNVPLILCKLERIFPPAFFDSMEHLPVHLSNEGLLGGPVQYRWMYPFERFLNKIKRTVKNKAHPEGSICEAYLLQETTNFCSYYFEEHREATINAVSCDPKISIFQTSGEALGSRTSRYLEDRELQTAILYVLLNCDEVNSFIEIFKSTLDITDESSVAQKIEEEFPKWFSSFVQNKRNGVTNKDLISLAWGPNRKVTIWHTFDVNGFRFQTSNWCEGKKSYNCGISVRANSHSDDEISYYGILKEVVQLHYPGSSENTVYLFNCDWFDPILNRGLRRLSPFDITEIKMSRRYSKFDPFILAHQATQTYYLRYPGRVRDKVDWAVVINVKPKNSIEFQTTIEPVHQEQIMSKYGTELEVNDERINLDDSSGIYEDITAVLEEPEEDNEDILYSSSSTPSNNTESEW